MTIKQLIEEEKTIRYFIGSIEPKRPSNDDRWFEPTDDEQTTFYLSVYDKEDDDWKEFRNKSYTKNEVKKYLDDIKKNSNQLIKIIGKI